MAEAGPFAARFSRLPALLQGGNRCRSGGSRDSRTGDDRGAHARLQLSLSRICPIMVSTSAVLTFPDTKSGCAITNRKNGIVVPMPAT